ncbi:MAG: hypothetical protein ACLPSH_00430 [Vulcanimicrobiaceae bacterium]|jgi:Na+/proline symporter
MVAGAGCLAALVPASGQVLVAASIVTKNVLGDWLNVATTDNVRPAATRILVLTVALLVLGFWLVARTSLVGLLLIGHSGVTPVPARHDLRPHLATGNPRRGRGRDRRGVAVVAALSFSNHATILG